MWDPWENHKEYKTSSGRALPAHYLVLQPIWAYVINNLDSSCLKILHFPIFYLFLLLSPPQILSISKSDLINEESIFARFKMPESGEKQMYDKNFKFSILSIHMGKSKEEMLGYLFPGNIENSLPNPAECFVLFSFANTLYYDHCLVKNKRRFFSHGNKDMFISTLGVQDTLKKSAVSWISYWSTWYPTLHPRLQKCLKLQEGDTAVQAYMESW